MSILSQMTSLLWLLIAFRYQMFPQLWQLEFKAVPFQQSVSLVGFLESRLMPDSMWSLHAAALCWLLQGK